MSPQNETDRGLHRRRYRDPDGVKPGARRGTGRKGGMDAVARKKKLTGMVWRGAGETVAVSLLLAGGRPDFLRSSGGLNGFPGGIDLLTMGGAGAVLRAAR